MSHVRIFCEVAEISLQRKSSHRYMFRFIFLAVLNRISSLLDQVFSVRVVLCDAFDVCAIWGKDPPRMKQPKNFPAYYWRSDLRTKLDQFKIKFVVFVTCYIASREAAQDRALFSNGLVVCAAVGCAKFFCPPFLYNSPNISWRIPYVT